MAPGPAPGGPPHPARPPWYAAPVLRAVPDRDLDDILAGVSRSFYLSLSILPRAVRTQLSVAYLVARAADTIADTHAVRADRRLLLLDGLRGAIGDGGDAGRAFA